MNLKNKLSEHRKQFGLSQDKLAEKLGVSRQTIISIEKGRYNPSLPLAMMIAEIFQTNVENIFILEEGDYK
jgi:putative transcriptional regulator